MNEPVCSGTFSLTLPWRDIYGQLHLEKWELKRG